jgi:DNA-binding MarR family transcriptional regulator
MDALDAALVEVRRVLQRPAYRRRLIDGLGRQVPLGTLRVVRAVQRTGADEDPTIGDVAELLAIDPSTASRAVDDGVARGLLARRACDRDRRRQRLSLTDDGRALLARAAQVRREILTEVAHDWAAGDLGALTEHLERLLTDFDRWQSSA